MADEKDDDENNQLFDDLTGIEELAEGNESYGDTGISAELEEPPDIQTQSSIDLSGLLEIGPDDLEGMEEPGDNEPAAFGDDIDEGENDSASSDENDAGEMHESPETSSDDNAAIELGSDDSDKNLDVDESESPTESNSELPPVQALAGSEADFTIDGDSDQPASDENFDISSPEELSELTQRERQYDLSGIEEIKTAAGPDLSSVTNQSDIETEMLGGAPPPPPESAKGKKSTPAPTPAPKPSPTPKPSGTVSAIKAAPQKTKEEFEPLSEAEIFEPMDTSPSTKQSLESDSGSAPLERVRSYSEKSVTPSASASPSFPFSLKVTGKIKEEFKQRVLDFFSQEKMGISPLDLEPQFDTGKLLIPRISEYAATVLIQKLRDSGARIEVGPSDLIFATDETRTRPNDPVARSQVPDKHWVYDPALASAADKIPLVASADRHILDPKKDKEWKVVDAITATATLKSKLVEAKDSEEYKNLLGALELELKHKAFYKGANAVLDYKIHLMPLHSPTEYKLTLQGSAVRVRKRKKPVAPETE